MRLRLRDIGGGQQRAAFVGAAHPNQRQVGAGRNRAANGRRRGRQHIRKPIGQDRRLQVRILHRHIHRPRRMADVNAVTRVALLKLTFDALIPPNCTVNIHSQNSSR